MNEQEKTDLDKLADHREYTESDRRLLFAVFNERDRRYEQRFKSIEEATKVAVAAMDRRLEGMNEFRAQIADQNRTWLPRNEYDARHQALDERTETLAKSIEAARSWFTTMVVSVIVGAATILGLVIAFVEKR